MKKQKKFTILNKIPLCIGLLFLVNPLFGIFDFLPDFVGYFLLVFGLDKIKRLNGDIEYGVKNSKTLCYFSIAFFVFMFYTFKMDSSWSLTLTFSYMAISIIFGNAAINGIFGGIDYLTDRHARDNFPSVFEARLMSKIYLWVKAIITLIPEMYALIEVKADEGLSMDKDYTDILATEKYAIVVCALCAVMLAVPFIKYTFSYIKSLKEDLTLNNNLLSMYTNEYSMDGNPIDFFSIYFGSGLIMVSHIFVYDFVLDTVHFLPEFLSVLFAFLGLLFIRKYVVLKTVWKFGFGALLFQVAIFFYRNKYIENVILDTLDITVLHLIISSLLAVGYIVFTFLFFSKIHQITSKSYEKMFQKKTTEFYEWGEIFFFIALAAGGANIVCCVWRPYFVAVLIVSLIISMYHYSKIYTKFN